jgi:hypothetical protein
MSEIGNDDELLAILDSAGKHIGTKSRTQVHRDGDWHSLEITQKRIA